MAHNVLETSLNSSEIGSFEEGIDNKYFEVLQNLVNEVHNKWFGDPFPFNDPTKADTKEFLGLLEEN